MGIQVKTLVWGCCIALLTLALYSGCKKELSLESRRLTDTTDTSATDTLPADTTQDTLNYQPTSAGSYWYYYPAQNPNQLFLSVISTNKDTSFHGHQYHVFSLDFGNTVSQSYMRREGNRYYAAGGLFSGAQLIAVIPGTLPQPLLDSLSYAEVLYLQSSMPVGTTWSQTQDFTYQSGTLSVEIKLNYSFTIQSIIAKLPLQNNPFSQVIEEQMKVQVQVLTNNTTIFNQTFNSDLRFANQVGLISFTSLDDTGQKIDLYTYQIQ